ncbi:MAG: hypothetical protein SFZ23_04465 [Planctomycetota bacterium]|nr:hypothetical protein [Planctomycetota bacterium]
MTTRRLLILVLLVGVLTFGWLRFGFETGSLGLDVAFLGSTLFLLTLCVKEWAEQLHRSNATQSQDR